MAIQPKAPPRVPGDLSRSSLTAFLGDSITYGNGSTSITTFGGRSYPTIASQLSGGLIKIYINAGISGNTTTQMLARIDADVINLRTPKPGKCIVLGGTNDVGTAVPLATSLANLSAIYDRLRGANIDPIACTIPPAVGHHSEIAALNVGIKHLCDVRGMLCVDFHAVLTDKTGTGVYIAGYSDDGTHPGPVGQRAMATRMVADLSSYYRLAPPNLMQDNTDFTNLIANPLFLLDADADGVADFWVNSAATGTCTPSLVTGDPNIFGNWQRMTVTVAGQKLITQSISATQNPSPQGWAEGEVLELNGLITTTVESGGLDPGLVVNMAGGAGLAVGSPYAQKVDVTRGFCFMRFTVPVGTTSMQVRLFSSVGSIGTGTVDFAQLSLYNLTRLGIA